MELVWRIPPAQATTALVARLKREGFRLRTTSRGYLVVKLIKVSTTEEDPPRFIVPQFLQRVGEPRIHCSEESGELAGISFGEVYSTPTGKPLNPFRVPNDRWRETSFDVSEAHVVTVFLDGGIEIFRLRPERTLPTVYEIAPHEVYEALQYSHLPAKVFQFEAAVKAAEAKMRCVDCRCSHFVKLEGSSVQKDPYEGRSDRMPGGRVKQAGQYHRLRLGKRRHATL